jgi:hypothetical protein
MKKKIRHIVNLLTQNYISERRKMLNHKGKQFPEVAHPQVAKKNVGGLPADWIIRKVMEGVRNMPAKGFQYTWPSTG